MKRRYWILSTDCGQPIIRGSFGPESTATYAKLNGLTVHHTNGTTGYRALQIAVETARGIYTGKNPLITRQVRVS